ncbi:MAG: hypothetical protein M9962_00710 [Oligoflexia bacterium]|nr:hypothetical protein [Oligoflexia bacterium]
MVRLFLFFVLAVSLIQTDTIYAQDSGSEGGYDNGTPIYYDPSPSQVQTVNTGGGDAQVTGWIDFFKRKKRKAKDCSQAKCNMIGIACQQGYTLTWEKSSNECCAKPVCKPTNCSMISCVMGNISCGDDEEVVTLPPKPGSCCSTHVCRKKRDDVGCPAMMPALRKCENGQDAIMIVKPRRGNENCPSYMQVCAEDSCFTPQQLAGYGSDIE